MNGCVMVDFVLGEGSCFLFLVVDDGGFHY